MQASSLAAPQTLNMYSYCGNDPVNYVDPSGLFFGKLFKWIKKAIKWIMIAVAVATAILSIVGAVFGAAALAAFTKTLLGGALSWIANIPSMIGSSLFAGTAGSIASALGFADRALAVATNVINGLLGLGVLAAAKATVGAIANSYSGDDDEYAPWWIRKIAILDAFRVLRTDFKCAKFFGLLNKSGKKIDKKKVDELKNSLEFISDERASGNFAHTKGNKITLEGGFFKDSWVEGSPQPYSIKNPRQGRAQTILHEIGHSKKLLKSPDNYGYPNDPTSPANQNEKTIKDHCGKGLSSLPTSIS